MMGESLGALVRGEGETVAASLRVLEQSLELDHALVLRRGAHGFALECSSGLDDRQRAALQMDLPGRILSHVLASREAVFVKDLERDTRFTGADLLLPEVSVRSVACVPVGEDELLAVLWIASRRSAPPLRESELRLAVSVARMVGDVLVRTRRYAEMQKLATLDTLTELMNRAQMDMVLAQEAERSSRYRFPLSAVMMDLDHFKRINDTHGHGAGDRVLRHFAGILRQGSRRVDYLFRYGGEEFLALLPHVPADNAKIYAERIRRLVRERLHRLAGLPEPCTLSAGIAAMPRDCETVDELLSRADAALYRAKESGRDRVELASSP
jgi:diguanylate cyclase (GGDEF)-like protein